jgi:hypothetical protein
MLTMRPACIKQAGFFNNSVETIFTFSYLIIGDLVGFSSLPEKNALSPISAYRASSAVATANKPSPGVCDPRRVSYGQLKGKV